MMWAPFLLHRQRLGNQPTAVCNAIERDEAAHSRALIRPQQRLIQRLEPVPQLLKAIMRVFANGIDNVLNVLGRRIFRQRAKLRIQLRQRARLILLRLATVERGRNEIPVIGERILYQPGELRMAVCRSPVT